ncbi:hypothetical protein TWF481_002144 [Arthrobotrys musiformis]|uniref:F-box domain-containing protein n=1 Tax=Arthrobotrys musiformis TaxID=47236 RepID=A0AAV9VU98_9PEZI
MAPITSVPAELIDQIGSYGLDQEDLLALRLTCKALGIRAREAHLNAIFSCRRVFLVPSSFENLIRVSKHPSGANLRVQKIIISYSSPYIHPYDGQTREDFEIWSAIVAKIRETTEAQSGEMDDFYQYNRYPVLLSLAFSNLPNIKELSFDFKASKDLTRPEINLIYPSLGYRSGTYRSQPTAAELSKFIADNWDDWHKLEYGGYGPRKSDVFSMVLYIIVSTRIKGIERIDDSDGEWSGLPREHLIVSSYSSSYLKSTFSNLKTLHITIDMATSPNAIVEFKRWAQAIGDNLEDLTIWNSNHGTPNSEAVRLPPGVFRKLKVIRFWDFKFDVDQFLEFIDGCAGPKSLTLGHCVFEDEIEDWFYLLRHIRRNRRSFREIVLQIHFKALDRRNGERETNLVVLISPDSEETSFKVKTQSGRGGLFEGEMALNLASYPPTKAAAVEF